MRLLPRRTLPLTALGLALAGQVVSAPPSLSPVPAPAPLAQVAVERSNEVLEKRVIGTSVKGRPIHAYRKGNPSATTKVLVLGSMHGDEKAGVTTARHLIAHVPVSTTADVWIIPTANPDGHAAGTRTNARKVDLNRNFPYRWKRINVGRPTYSGRSAASEPETRALIAFLREVRPRYVASIHQPFAGIGTAPKDPAYVRRLATALRLPVEGYACSRVCYGSMSSWYNTDGSGPGVMVTVEFSRSPSSSFLRSAAAAILRASYAY